MEDNLERLGDLFPETSPPPSRSGTVPRTPRKRRTVTRIKRKYSPSDYEVGEDAEDLAWKLSNKMYKRSELSKLNLEEIEKIIEDPMVKNDADALSSIKRVRRQIKNRECARVSREKAKLRNDCLEKEIKGLKILNKQ